MVNTQHVYFFTRHRLDAILFKNIDQYIHTVIMLIIDVVFVSSSFMGNSVCMYVKLNILNI